MNENMDSVLFIFLNKKKWLHKCSNNKIQGMDEHSVHSWDSISNACKLNLIYRFAIENIPWHKIMFTLSPPPHHPCGIIICQNDFMNEFKSKVHFLIFRSLVYDGKTLFEDTNPVSLTG